MTAPAAIPSRPIKVLMLHGYTQSGPLFQAKTGALRKTLQKAFPAGIELVYPTAPLRLSPADESFLATPADTEGKEKDGKEAVLDAWAWWRRKDNPPSNSAPSTHHSPHAQPFLYEGLDESLTFLASLFQSQGPFDGAIGFSQGAALAAILASLLEPNRSSAFEAQLAHGGTPFPASFLPDSHTAQHRPSIHPPLLFAVCYSGFAPHDNPAYAAFYSPRIATPVLHFLGTQDVVVDEKRSLALVKACRAPEEADPSRYVVYHPGGHFLPSTQKACVSALVGFIREVVGAKEEGERKEEGKGSVEDMDVPF